MLMYELQLRRNLVEERDGSLAKVNAQSTFAILRSVCRGVRRPGRRIPRLEAEVFGDALQFRKLGKYAGIALPTRVDWC